MKKPDLIELAGAAWLLWVTYWTIAARFVNATRYSEPLLLRATHLVPLYAGFFLIFNAHPFIHGRLYFNQSIRIAGLTVVLAGLLFAVWARVHLGRYWSGIITLKERHELIRSGPYQYVRHPIYSGMFAATVGSAVIAATPDAFLGSVLILVAFLIKIKREESLLMRQFGEKYQQYKTQVSALLPFVY
jgi:protein-S-isoprenylcysteine O-methyltransferase Ste14